MSVNSASGTTLYIGTSAVPTQFNFDPSDPTENAAALAEYVADSYIEIGELEDLGEFGDESQPITFTSLNDARVRKFKGPRDAGTMAVVVGDDSSDDGQAALIAAEGSNLNFNFKVVGNDAASLGGDGSVSYFSGQVMSKRKNVGNATNVVRRNFSVGINTGIIEIAAT